MQVPALIQIHLQLPQIIILKLSVNLLSCSSAHFVVFPFLPQVLPLDGNFAQYCVVLFTCLQWVTFPKKSWPIIIDVRKSWSIVIDTRRSHCPIDLRFQEVSNLLVWCELFVNLYLRFDFKRITTTLSEFIGHIDLTDFVQFCLNIPGIMANKSVLGNFDTWNICPVASIYQTRLAYT